MILPLKKSLSRYSLAAMMALLPVHAAALEALADEQMSEVSGAGLAFAFDDFSFRMAPTSYIELSGTATTDPNWKRGDVRYYGWSFTGNDNDTTATDWANNGCNGTEAILSCPLGSTGVANFAAVYDPFVLRVFQYEGYDFQGSYLTGANRPTVLELIGPSQSDAWRWSFWGEIEVDRGGASASHLQSQTIISGKPITRDGTPTILRIMQAANDSDRTFGITYQSALSGDFRFSVAQTNTSPDTLHSVPDFNNNEGLHFKNVDAFVPLGHLHSQAITLDDSPTADDGNFSITLTQVPNVDAVYNEIYCGNILSVDGACAVADTNIDYFGRKVVKTTTQNPETHGYIRWGDFSLGTYPTATDRTNGIYFVDTAGAVTNIGLARMEGVLIQYMRLTTLAAN